MSETAQKLLEQIRALTEAERNWIADELGQATQPRRRAAIRTAAGYLFAALLPLVTAAVVAVALLVWWFYTIAQCVPMIDN